MFSNWHISTYCWQAYWSPDVQTRCLLNNKFNICIPTSTDSMTVDEIDVAANFLVETYSADLDNDFATELNFFASLLKSNFIAKDNEEATEVWMFRAAMSNSSH